MMPLSAMVPFRKFISYFNDRDCPK